MLTAWGKIMNREPDDCLRLYVSDILWVLQHNKECVRRRVKGENRFNELAFTFCYKVFFSAGVENHPFLSRLVLVGRFPENAPCVPTALERNTLRETDRTRSLQVLISLSRRFERKADHSGRKELEKAGNGEWGQW